MKFVALEEKAGPVELRALEVIKGIRQPHLLGTFGSWQQDGQLIIAMELADRTLMDRFRESVGRRFPGIPVPEIFEHFLDAAQALDYLNEPRHTSGEDGPKGIQDRDVKPQNLLLLGGSVKVADFGLARVLEHSTTGHTGSLTPSYAAPEFFDRKTSSHSDQYSLAVTYCHLRGGRLPFEGNPLEVMNGHTHGVPDLSMVPKAERPAVARALSKSPRDRWPSCRMFIQAVMDSAYRTTDVAVVDAPPTTDPLVWRDSEPNPLADPAPASPDEFRDGPGQKPDPIREPAHAKPHSRKRSVFKLAAWALVAAVLLIAAILLFPRDRPVDSVAPPYISAMNEKADALRSSRRASA